MAVPETIDELIDLYPEYFQPNEADGVDGVVQLDLDGDGGGAYYLVIEDQTLDIHEGTHDDPTVTIRTTAERWLKINRGEASPMTLMMMGQLTVDGSLAMATKFQSLFDPRCSSACAYRLLVSV
jgi:putative sterol carrier protein